MPTESSEGGTEGTLYLRYCRQFPDKSQWSIDLIAFTKAKLDGIDPGWPGKPVESTLSAGELPG